MLAPRIWRWSGGDIRTSVRPILDPDRSGGKPPSMSRGSAMDIASDLPIGRIRGLRACASPRGTFGVLALDHRQNLRSELRPTTRLRGPMPSRRVQAGGGPRAASARPASCSTPRSGRPSRSSTARSRPAAGCSWRSRRPAMTARPPPGSAASSTAGAWPRRSGWARRPPSCSSTTTPMRPMPPTRSDSSRPSPATAGPRTSPCSSSRCRSRSTGGAAARGRGSAPGRRRDRPATHRAGRGHPQGGVPVRPGARPTGPLARRLRRARIGVPRSVGRSCRAASTTRRSRPRSGWPARPARAACSSADRSGPRRRR